MMIPLHLTVAELIERAPIARSVLIWYGVKLDALDLELTLVELCDDYGLDPEEVIIDLAAVDEHFDTVDEDDFDYDEVMVH